MSAGEYLNNQLLVAMPTLADPNFSHSVTLVCEHNERGALGLVINRPLDMRMSEVLDQLSLATDDARLRDMPVLAGGPVQRDRGFVLHRPGVQGWESTMRVSDTLHVTTSRDVLAAMVKGDGPRQAVIALGYAGWEAGQLDEELLQNAWLTVPCDDSLIFDLPFEQRWHAAARLLGIDLSRICTQAGRA
ncbi:MAG TPA: YqgE/AlgH family protein [Steroidobacteraceae bacterium]|nr:YqgE/AlgH family protein [Steroidobacteraceae bacterium]